tara:strand:+ start:239 stop:832 length:594 start_codon:yes stop_codon:yes gene_type:complete
MKNQKEIILKIIDALPQLQCKKCTYDDCKSYANAIVNNDEEINKCEPGSSFTELQLKNILDGVDKIEKNDIKAYKIASIDLDECIGCTICIKVCPVDAIIGARHQKHFIIDNICNGCELCIKQCPVDCMEMIINDEKLPWEWPSKQADLSKDSYYSKVSRNIRTKQGNKKLNEKSSAENYVNNLINKNNIKDFKEYE